MKRFALLLLLTAISATPCPAREFARVTFPGFSVELPKGTVVSTSKLGFGGRHELSLPAPTLLDRMNPLDHSAEKPRVVVTWNRHDLDDGESFPLTRDLVLKGLPMEGSRVLKEGSSAPHVWVAVIGVPAVPIGFGSRQCEIGFNVDVVVSMSRDVDEQYQITRRIAESVKCALTDANRRRPEAITRLPQGFGRFKGEQFPTYGTVDGENLLINFTTGDVTRNPQAFRAVVTALASQIAADPGAQISTTMLPSPEGAGRKSTLARVNIEGNEEYAGTVYVGGLWCPKLGVSFMTLYTALQSAETRARVLLDAVYCPGERGEIPPDAKPMFEAACTKGNDIACQSLKEFAF